MRVVLSNCARSSGVSLEIVFFLFAIVLLQQAPYDPQVVSDVGDQSHDSCDVRVTDRRFHAGYHRAGVSRLAQSALSATLALAVVTAGCGGRRHMDMRIVLDHSIGGVALG